MNAIEVKDLAVSYGQVDALHGVSFDVPQGTLVSLIGANGAGKTTLLKALMGALPARAGQVLLQGQALGNTPVEERVRRGMCLVPEKRSLFASMKVEDNLRLGATPSAAAPISRASWNASTRCSRYWRSGASSWPARCPAASSRWSPSAAP